MLKALLAILPHPLKLYHTAVAISSWPALNLEEATNRTTSGSSINSAIFDNKLNKVNILWFFQLINITTDVCIELIPRPRASTPTRSKLHDDCHVLQSFCSQQHKHWTGAADRIPLNSCTCSPAWSTYCVVLYSSNADKGRSNNWLKISQAVLSTACWHFRHEAGGSVYAVE